MIWLELFLAFLKVGVFSFGGAYSSIPLIREVVTSCGWMTEEELTYMIAVSESTPGPIMVNIATFVGTAQGGVPGALVATFAVVLPAFLIILLVAAAMEKMLTQRFVQAALGGLKPCIVGLVLATGAFMVLSHCVSLAAPPAETAEPTSPAVDLRALLLTVVLAAVLFLSKPLFKKKISPIALILIAAVLGAAVYAA